jgi:hypothetical protein
MNEQALDHLCQGSSSVRVSLVHAPNNIIVRVRSLSYIRMFALPFWMITFGMDDHFWNEKRGLLLHLKKRKDYVKLYGPWQKEI